MQITYGNKTLGTEPPGGTDLVDGFMMPSARQNVQWAEYLRAADAVPIVRSPNRKRTITGTIYPASATTLARAQQLRMAWYESLPSTGALKIIQDAVATMFVVAALESIEVAENTEGVSYGLVFTFQVGPPSFPPVPNTPIATESGLNIETESGQQISSDL